MYNSVSPYLLGGVRINGNEKIENHSEDHTRIENCKVPPLLSFYEIQTCDPRNLGHLFESLCLFYSQLTLILEVCNAFLNQCAPLQQTHWLLLCMKFAASFHPRR